MTWTSKPITSAWDHQNLLRAIERARSSWLTYAPFLDLFSARLRRSRIVPPTEVPSDMITMNSRFVLEDRRTGERTTCTLVYPQEESPRMGMVSVLSPMGTAVLGARVGEEVCWTSAVGPELARVEDLLYQPEWTRRQPPAPVEPPETGRN